MVEDHIAETSYRNGAGSTSLIAGVVAAVASFVPLVGGVITIAAALVALVCGWVGVKRVDEGVASNQRDSLIGIGLGLAALFVAFLVFAATHSAT